MRTFIVSCAKPVLLILITVGSIVAVFQTKLAPVFHTTQSISNDFSVTGEGSVAVVPDQAEISLGILINDLSVKSAQTKANERINLVKQDLIKMGIKSEDIKTNNYNINPNYDFTLPTRAIKDYTVNITLGIKVKDLSKVGTVIDTATAGGLNTVNSLEFSLTDRQKALDEARKLAVADAKRKAQTAADTAGISLGKITYYNEYEPGTSYPEPYYDTGFSKQGIGGSEQTVNKNTEINPGGGEIKLEVTLTYKTL